MLAVGASNQQHESAGDSKTGLWVTCPPPNPLQEVTCKRDFAGSSGPKEMSDEGDFWRALWSVERLWFRELAREHPSRKTARFV
jgi:hypothetical protein